jgi:hypothetical protein
LRSGIHEIQQFPYHLGRITYLSVHWILNTDCNADVTENSVKNADNGEDGRAAACVLRHGGIKKPPADRGQGSGPGAAGSSIGAVVAFAEAENSML